MPFNKGLPVAPPQFGGFPFQYGPAYGLFGDGFDGFEDFVTKNFRIFFFPKVFLLCCANDYKKKTNKEKKSFLKCP